MCRANKHSRLDVNKFLKLIRTFQSQLTNLLTNFYFFEINKNLLKNSQPLPPKINKINSFNLKPEFYFGRRGWKNLKYFLPKKSSTNRIEIWIKFQLHNENIQEGVNWDWKHVRAGVKWPKTFGALGSIDIQISSDFKLPFIVGLTRECSKLSSREYKNFELAHESC